MFRVVVDVLAFFFFLFFGDISVHKKNLCFWIWSMERAELVGCNKDTHHLMAFLYFTVQNGIQNF